MPDPSVSARLFGDEDDDEDDEDESSSPRPAGSSMSIADDDADAHHAKPSGEFLADALALFDDPSARGVHDWSTSDALAFKVLGPYVAAHPRRRRTARHVLAWATRASERGSPPVNPYRRRAGVVAFLNYVDGDDARAGGLDSSDGGLPSPWSGRRGAIAGRGGDGLFGDGFVAELAKACGDVLATVDSETPPGDSSADREGARRRGVPRWPSRGGAEGAHPGAEGAVASDDEVPVDDPTLSPMAAEAWAVDGAWAVLGLCARESARGWTARGSRRSGAGVTDGSNRRLIAARRRRATSGVAPTSARGRRLEGLPSTTTFNFYATHRTLTVHTGPYS